MVYDRSAQDIAAQLWQAVDHRQFQCVCADSHCGQAPDGPCIAHACVWLCDLHLWSNAWIPDTATLCVVQGGMAGSPQMEEYMRNFNMNPEEVNKQLEDLGVSQEEIVSKMLGDPELREVSSSPPGHVCACNGIHEEPGVTQEETGSNKASCGHEGIAAMAFLCMQLRLRGSQEPALDCEWQPLTSAGDPRAP